MRREPCGACGGTGKIDVPDLEEQIAAHLMNNPGVGLALQPGEVRQLGVLLGLLPPTTENHQWHKAQIPGDQAAGLCYCDGHPHVHIPESPNKEDPE